MKKGLSILLAAAMTLSLAACGGSTETANTTAAGGDNTTAAADASEGADAGTATGEGKTVGVAMPTQSSERWLNDGANIKEQLEAKGYKVELQYAEDDV